MAGVSIGQWQGQRHAERKHFEATVRQIRVISSQANDTEDFWKDSQKYVEAGVSHMGLGRRTTLLRP